MDKKNILSKIEKRINTGLLDEAWELAESNLIDADAQQLVKGIIEGRRGKFHESELILKKVLNKNPNNIVAKLHLGTALVSLKKYVEAKSYVQESLKKFPNDLQAIANMALIMLEDQLYVDVIELVEPVYKTSKSPVHICALISANRSLFNLNKTDKLLSEAIEKYPDAKDVLRLKADYLSEVDPVSAKELFSQIISLDPTNKAVRWNSSFVDLRLRNFPQGWENYEYGLDNQIGKIGRPLPEMINLFNRVHNLNEVDPNKYLVICGEQGIGDQVLFMSALHDLVLRHKKIIYLADSRLIPIISRSFPTILTCEFGMVPNLVFNQQIQGYIPVGSLMKDLRPSIESFENGKAVYLLPNKNKVDTYRAKLKKEFPEKPIVGISWKGGFWERAQKTKTLQLELWDSFLSRKDMNFVSLQYGDVDADRKLAKQRGYNLKFISGIDFKKDIDSWHSLACSCDLIVSISTALVHFAGASGKKVYVLLNDRQQPFIWGLNDTKSIAYKDVHLVRKQKDADPEVFFKQLNSIFL